VSASGREVLVDEKQREAERAALRKVRGKLDEIGADESRQRMLLKRVAVAVIGVVLAGVGYLATCFVK